MKGQLSFSPSHDNNRNLGGNGFWESDECMKCKLPKRTKQKLWKSPFDDEITASTEDLCWINPTMREVETLFKVCNTLC